MNKENELSYEELLKLYNEKNAEVQRLTRESSNFKMELELTKTSLNDTKTILKNTKSELSDTKVILKDTKSELKNTKKEIKGLKVELKGTKKENKKINIKNKILDKEVNKKIKIIKEKEDEILVIEKEKKDLLEYIAKLVKALEDKDIKLKKQLIEKYHIKSDKKKVVINEAETLSTVSFDDLKKEKNKDNKESKKRGRKKGTKDASNFDFEKIETETIVIDDTKVNSNIHICSACGAPLKELPDLIEYKMEYVPSQIKVIKYIIKRYICSSCGNKEEIPQINIFDNESFLTPSLSSMIINYKYNYGLPLYRIEDITKTFKVKLERAKLANYVIKSGVELEVIYDRLKEKLIHNDSRIIQADETPFKNLEVSKKKKREKCYMWLYSSCKYDDPIYIYEYQESREKNHPKEFLKDFKGYLVCDDYSAYDDIINTETVRCWFHAKKRYADLIKTMSEEVKKTSKAVIAHNKISDIFYQENLIEDMKLTTDMIKQKREEILRPLVDDYFSYIKETYDSDDFDKGSVFSNAIKYSLKIKDDLYRFFEDGRLPLTNNVAERGIRPFVILRKASLFSESEKGAKASAILLSIVQTAKLNLVKPDLYIKWVLENIDTVKMKDIDQILPISKTLPEELYYKRKDLE